jgi:sigma-B regulation protein RsbU (phosphoserine phosphatase)
MSPWLRRHLMRIRTRFTLLVFLGAGLVAGTLAVIAYLGSSEALLASRQDALLTLAREQAAQLDSSLSQVSAAPRNLTSVLEIQTPTQEEVVDDLLRHLLVENPKIYGMALAFAPRAFDPRYELFAPYAYRSPQGVKTMNLVDPSYAYLVQDWFQIPFLLARPIWGEPYFDEGGGQILMTTYSAPALRQGKVFAVATADIDLRQLGRQVQDISVGKMGYAFLLTRQGTFLVAPNDEWVMRETIFSLAEAHDRPELRVIGRRMIRGGAGVERVRNLYDDLPIWLAFAPIKGPGWTLAVAAPEEEVLAPVRELAHQQGMWALGGMLALALVVWLLVMGLTRPLERLARAARRLAGGDLSTQVEDVKSGDEIGDLAASFNGMVKELNHYVQELTSTTKEKTRIQSELDMARQIQQSVLPRIYPPFPDRQEFDLFARNLPAREVGGDFYDFFFVDDDHLGMVVADVSGKGVPAALFMTVSRTLIKTAAVHHPHPAKALAEVNDQLVPDNEMCMFVTVFYGVYELSTGVMRFVSAGHPSPILRRADGETRQLPKLAGRALGVMENLTLEVGEIDLMPGDCFLVFTDGLDEAVNERGEMFGIERAAEWLARTEPASAPVVLDRLIEAWRGFTGAVEQFDDLTLLTFRRRL